MLILYIILGVLGAGLMISPFIGLTLDLIRSKQTKVFLGFLGLVILCFSIFKLLPNIMATTIFAFLLTPIVFFYMYAMKSIGKKDHFKSKEKNLSETIEDEILDHE